VSTIVEPISLSGTSFPTKKFNILIKKSALCGIRLLLEIFDSSPFLLKIITILKALKKWKKLLIN
jgi:hypothetical protein